MHYYNLNKLPTKAQPYCYSSIPVEKKTERIYQITIYFGRKKSETVRKKFFDEFFSFPILRGDMP